MINQSKRNVRRSELEKDMKESFNGCRTKKDALDFLFGTHDDDYQTDYVIKHRYGSDSKLTVLNRINYLWVYPLFIVLIPFRFVIFGDYKINEDSFFGKVLIKLIGELK